MFFDRQSRIWKAEVRKLAASRPECATAKKLGRFFRPWKASLQEGRSPITDAQPWISFAAIELIGNVLTKDMAVFEFGGGGSTLFFTRRVAHVVTVEHDAAWFPIIERAVRESGCSNWKGLLRPAEEGADPSACVADPDAYLSDDDGYRGKNFRSYASAIDAWADGHFDLVLVDGRARPSCLKHALSKVRPGGLLVLDNSDRPYYTQRTGSLIEPLFVELLSCGGPVPYLEWFTQTTIWKRR